MATAKEKQFARLMAELARDDTRDELDALVAVPPAPPDFLDRDFPAQCSFIEDPSRLKLALCTRRCLAAGTMVATPRGAVAIEDLRVGDEVFDENGRPTKVVNTFDQGVLPVSTFWNNGSPLVTATEDHRFLVTHVVHRHWRKEMRLGQIYKGIKIVRGEAFVRMGDVNEPHAYVIGAFLGDGCKYKPNGSFVLSGQDEQIVRKCASLVDAPYHKMSGNNHSWLVQGTFNHFEEWMHGRYAHDKEIDFDVVKTWNRRSCLDFLAGLIDTDGSLHQGKDGPMLRISMQNKKVLEIAQWLFLSLWGCSARLYEDGRDRYKNGSVWNLNIKHVYFVNRIVSDLHPFIQCARKRTYSAATSSNFNPSYMGGVVKSAGEAHCYDIEVSNDSHLFLLANGLVSHNSGKSYGDGLYLFKEAYENPRSTVIYFGLTRQTAKYVMWRPVLDRINRDFRIGAKPNLSELSWTLPNESVIYLLGVDSSEDEMRKAFGQKFKLVIVDEAALYRIDLTSLVYSVLQPATADEQGTICLTGMPSNLKRGLFFQLTQERGDDAERKFVFDWSEDRRNWRVIDKENGAEWSGHFWTAFDNPHMATNWRAEIEEKKRNNPRIEETPFFQQEYLGKWVIDKDKCVYKFDPDRNTFDTLPEYASGDWHYILGVDLGYEDDTAFCVMAWHDHDRTAYVLETWGKNHMVVSDVVDRIKLYMLRYEFDGIVIDGSNKMAVEEMRKRHDLWFVQSVQKRYKVGESRRAKANMIEVMNADFIMERIKVHPDRCKSLILEYDNLIWDDRNEDGLGPRQEHPGCPNHQCDAALYSWMSVYSYLSDTPAAAPLPGTQAWLAQEAKALEQRDSERLEREIKEAERAAIEDFENGYGTVIDVVGFFDA